MSISKTCMRKYLLACISLACAVCLFGVVESAVAAQGQDKIVTAEDILSQEDKQSNFSQSDSQAAENASSEDELQVTTAESKNQIITIRKEIAGNVTVYSLYCINYIPRDVSGYPDSFSQWYYAGSCFIMPNMPSAWTRSGWRFTGWTDNASSNTPIWQPGWRVNFTAWAQNPSISSIRIYPCFERNYQVFYYTLGRCKGNNFSDSWRKPNEGFYLGGLPSGWKGPDWYEFVGWTNDPKSNVPKWRSGWWVNFNPYTFPGSGYVYLYPCFSKQINISYGIYTWDQDTRNKYGLERALKLANAVPVAVAKYGTLNISQFVGVAQRDAKGRKFTGWQITAGNGLNYGFNGNYPPNAVISLDNLNTSGLAGKYFRIRAMYDYK